MRVQRLTGFVIENEVGQKRRAVVLSQGFVLIESVDTGYRDRGLALDISRMTRTWLAIVDTEREYIGRSSLLHRGNLALELSPDVIDRRLDRDSHRPSRGFLGNLDKEASVEAAVA